MAYIGDGGGGSARVPGHLVTLLKTGKLGAPERSSALATSLGLEPVREVGWSSRSRELIRSPRKGGRGDAGFASASRPDDGRAPIPENP